MRDWTVVVAESLLARYPALRVLHQGEPPDTSLLLF